MIFEVCVASILAFQFVAFCMMMRALREYNRIDKEHKEWVGARE